METKPPKSDGILSRLFAYIFGSLSKISIVFNIFLTPYLNAIFIKITNICRAQPL